MTVDEYKRYNPGNNFNANDSQGALYRGKVENNQDPYGLGRVQVRIPVLHGVPGNTGSSVPTAALPWAHICSLSAGPGRGTVLTPMVGDTVWILFENNQKDRPVVLGSSYGIANDQNEYNVTKSSGKMFSNTKGRSISSLATPGLPGTARDLGDAGQVLYKSTKGAEISFSEEDGNESVKIIDRIGQIIEMHTDAPAGTRPRTVGDRSRPGQLPTDAFYSKGSINIQSASPNTTPDSKEDSKLYLTHELANLFNGTSYIHMQGNHIRISNHDPNKFKDEKNNQIIVDNEYYHPLNPTSEEDAKTYYWQIDIVNDKIVIRNSQCTITLNEDNLNLKNSGCSIDMNGDQMVMRAGHIALYADRIDLNK